MNKLSTFGFLAALALASAVSAGNAEQQNYLYYIGGPAPVAAPCAPVCPPPPCPPAPVCQPVCEPVCPPPPCETPCCAPIRGIFG